MSANRWWILLALAAAAFGFAAGRWTASQPSAPDPLRLISEIRFDWLDLTPAQAAEVERLRPAHESAVVAGCNAQCADRCRLVRVLTAPEWDRDQARAAVEAMCEAHRASEMATLDYLEALRAILTPGQQARLLTRVGACLCETCALGRDSCCTSERGKP